jgi:hypothetical protein
VVDAFAAEQAYAAPALAPAPEVAAARFFATVTPGPAGGVARPPPAATVTPVAVSVTSPSYRAPLLVGSVPSPTAVPPTPTPASQSVVRSPDAW